MRPAFICTALISTVAAVAATRLEPAAAVQGVSREAYRAPATHATEVFATGIVEGRTREAELRFQLAGWLSSIEVVEGQSVRSGEPLARIDADTWTHQLSEAQANLAAAEAAKERLVNGASQEARGVVAARVRAAAVQADTARKLYDRVSGLSSHAISKQELDDKHGALDLAESRLAIARRQLEEINAAPRDDELRMAEARIALARAKVDQAKSVLAKTVLHAPYDGLVLRVQAETGELVGPESASPILTIVDASEARVRAYVEEADALRIVPGITAAVSADGIDGPPLPGTVLHCAPSMTPKENLRNDPGERVDVKVREVVIRLDDVPGGPRSGLVVGLPVDVFFQLGERAEQFQSSPDGTVLVQPVDVFFDRSM